jgi:hypothetical protein
VIELCLLKREFSQRNGKRTFVPRGALELDVAIIRIFGSGGTYQVECEFELSVDVAQCICLAVHISQLVVRGGGMKTIYDTDSICSSSHGAFLISPS